jgi:serine/threonine protein kinase
MTNHDRPGPARRLLGKVLGGWELVELLRDDDPDASGFSIGYRAVHVKTGKEGYLKAVDFSWAMGDPTMSTQTIAEILNSYNHEQMLTALGGSSMDRVAGAIAHGRATIEGGASVLYLVFELAAGDARSRVYGVGAWSTRERLRVLHEVANGLRQLHNADVLHQSLYAAKVLDYGPAVGAKVTGLRRAWLRGAVAPSPDGRNGALPQYAPPEILYQFELPDVRHRIQAHDMYLFGSFMMYMFTELYTTTALINFLDIVNHPREYGHRTFDDVLVPLREAFDQVIEQFESQLPADLRPDVAEELVDCFTQLCEPDPRRRGHPRARGTGGNPFSLERYVSILDRLEKRAGYSAPGA